jgi:hypothetical protein
MVKRTAMTHYSSNAFWSIDLDAGLATSGSVQISYDDSAANGIALTFVKADKH